ncbi:hypothetical protein TNCT_371271 [Trichonephila clavata]|uniref:Uncharacterized protein n=1 Tax=Trichonephila clavata TaxID=2740835 RepID=A0A8X6FAU4_TRICU|nr:hypothetical protein TNCT_371271 [Trichonephila clavata]
MSQEKTIAFIDKDYGGFIFSFVFLSIYQFNNGRKVYNRMQGIHSVFTNLPPGQTKSVKLLNLMKFDTSPGLSSISSKPKAVQGVLR